MPTLTRTEVEVRSSHLRSFSLPAHGHLRRVALVPEQAVLLADDHVTVSIRVGAGRALEVVEPGGTVAYAMRGRRARWDVSVEVEDGGSLVWHGEPFVVSQGADVDRATGVLVGAGAEVVIRETLVLGRSNEGPGRLRSSLDVRRDGMEVLVEGLDSATGFGVHRVLDQVLHLGSACVDDEHTMALESGDVLHRWLGAATHASPLRTCRAAQSSARPE